MIIIELKIANECKKPSDDKEIWCEADEKFIGSMFTFFNCCKRRKGYILEEEINEGM